MENEMEIINEFLKEYSKQYEFYEKLSNIVAKLIDQKLKEKGIRAIVTNRAKNESRLKEKLIIRNKEKKYSNKEEIINDIIDLSGVRIALYFPNDRDKVDSIIKKEFNCLNTKDFPNENRELTYKKRFSGYWAKHYRVKIDKEKHDGVSSRFVDSITEIQVASVLMHAWAEVEHDLAYKPLNGTLSEEENAILDELNGLVMAGEIALERLQKAGEERIKANNKLKNQYDISNLIYSSINNSKIETGNLEKLFLVLNDYNENSTSKLKKYLSVVDINKPISNEIIKKVI